MEGILKMDSQDIGMALSDEMHELMKQLIMNNHLRVAGYVMISYLIRSFHISQPEARALTKAWMKERFSKELCRYLHRKN
jgi:hypothetical protein